MALIRCAKRLLAERVELTLWGMLNRVMVRPLASLGSGLKLTEDAFVDALHKRAGAVPDHFGYGVGHVAAVLGIHLLNDL